MVLDKDCSFLLNMAFISLSEVENIYISCENIKYALYYIHNFLISLLSIPDSKDTLGPCLVVVGYVGLGKSTLDQRNNVNYFSHKIY